MRAMVEALTARCPGRPLVARPDSETESLRKREAELNEQLEQASTFRRNWENDAPELGSQQQIHQRRTESQILEFLEAFEKLRMQCPRHSASILCQSVGLSYSTLRQWRSRWRANQPVIRRPGPPKGSARTTMPQVE